MTKKEALAKARQIVREFEAGIPAKMFGPNELRRLQLGTLVESIKGRLCGESTKTPKAIVDEFRAGIPRELIGPSKIQVRQLETLRRAIAEVINEL